MKLTQTEMKVVTRLRKVESGMYRAGYWLLAVGVMSYIAAGYGAFLMERSAAKEPNPQIASVLYTFLFPSLLILVVQGSWFLAIAIANWRGNPTRVLLLKLIDSHTKDVSDHSPDAP